MTTATMTTPDECFAKAAESLADTMDWPRNEAIAREWRLLGETIANARRFG